MRFRIGLGLIELASTYVDDLDLVEQARPILQRLAADTQETVHLGMPNGGSIVYIDKVESTHSLRMVPRIGGLNPLHCTAL
ncbi:MAG TPA: IclR family transcriptional regulator, partial [Candidatus Dormibacteraeota bacterium]|nr:IclR family transcriptional regulator [Candidatus Dormibacteraeota bacterium]